MVGLADGAPASALLEECDDVVGVLGNGLKIHQKRAQPVVCHDRSRKDSAFEAMGPLFLHNAARREICLSCVLKIDGESIKILLYGIWGAEMIEKLSFVGD